MLHQNEIGLKQERNRGFRSYFILALTSLLLIGFHVDLTHASSIKTAYKYQEIKTISKSLKKQSNAEDLEALVEKAKDFVAAHPEYKRVDEVYYPSRQRVSSIGSC